jgi:hypothetical protein
MEIAEILSENPVFHPGLEQKSSEIVYMSGVALH